MHNIQIKDREALSGRLIGSKQVDTHRGVGKWRCRERPLSVLDTWRAPNAVRAPLSFAQVSRADIVGVGPTCWRARAESGAVIRLAGASESGVGV